MLITNNRSEMPHMEDSQTTQASQVSKFDVRGPLIFFYLKVAVFQSLDYFKGK